MSVFLLFIISLVNENVFMINLILIRDYHEMNAIIII